jgi:hypothetical protein
MGRQLSDFRILVAPGLHGSGEGHWQTRWETLYPWFERIEQWHWDQPDLDGDWTFGLTQLERLVQGLPAVTSCRCGPAPTPRPNPWRNAARSSR